MWPKFAEDHFETFASVILRVPGIFIIDYWWQYDRHRLWPQSLDWLDLVGVILTAVGPLHGLMLLLIRLERLVDLYMHYISASLLAAAHLFSAHYVYAEQQHFNSESSEDTHFFHRQLAALLIHVTIASLVAFLLDIQNNVQRTLLAVYSLPVVARLSNLPVKDLHIIHSFSSAFTLLQAIYFVLKCIPSVMGSLKFVYQGLLSAAQMYSWLGVVIAAWNMIFIPVHFLVFWVTQLLAHLYLHLNSTSASTALSKVSTLSQRVEIDDTSEMVTAASRLDMLEWYLVFLRCVSEICDSPVSLISTAVAVAYAARGVLCATKFYLQGYNAFIHDNLMHSGWTEGLTLVLLALQTGLVELKMPQRAAVMSIILFIVMSSLIQSMFEITEPFLLALSASHNRSVVKHLRTLALCAFLFGLPWYMSFILCRLFQMDFWMLVVISSCIMTSVQVIGLIVMYVLFIYDATRGESWEALDDVVYYAHAITRILEFLMAVFVVCAGLHESVTAQWSWINSSVLLIHCYFNVWQRLHSGWKSFLLRRKAVHKIESLPMASEEDLKRYGDVCAICYGEMKTARITSCNHLYHGTCLRKWLYVQEHCPMCHAVVTPTKSEEEEESSDNSTNSDSTASEQSANATEQNTFESSTGQFT